MTAIWNTAEIACLRELALAGEDAEGIGRALAKSQSDIRAMAELINVPLGTGSKREWCTKCAHPVHALDRRTGWCHVCTVLARVEKQRIADDEEEARRQEEARRAADVVKQRRHRMREVYDAAPRSKREEA